MRPNPLRSSSLWILALCTCLTSPALAAWPHDPVSGNVAVCTATGQQQSPAIVSDGAGGAIITWHDFRSGTNYDIYAQRINSLGLPQWTANGVVVCNASSDQQFPAIVSDGAGGAVIAWQDIRGATGVDIYAQRINAAGVPQWTANGVALCTAGNDQQFPALVSDGAGGAIATWRDYRNVTNADVYAQRINAAGVVQWTANGVPVCVAAGDQFTPTLASDGAGGAIITWTDNRSGTYDIYSQHLNAAGAPQWTVDGIGICTAANLQQNPSIAADGAGGAIITWTDYRTGTQDIYAQRVNSAGTAYWAANGVALCSAVNAQDLPVIASDAAGGAIVAWEDLRSGPYDIYAQRINGAGAVQWAADGVALCTAAGAQSQPAIIADGFGGAIVTWYDLRSGTTNDVYAQRINSTGVTQWTANGVALCTAVGDQINPVIATDGAAGAIVAWQDARSGVGQDVYAQRVDRFGYLGAEPTIATVQDVPSDQGGRVKVAWYPSYLDVVSDNNLAAYDIYRSAPGSAAFAARKRGARVVSSFGTTPEPGRPWFVVRPAGAQLYAWELIGSVTPAHFLSAYGFIAQTTGDSTGLGNPLSIYMVVGRNSGGTMFWPSSPDSGYSVDNLPPVAPAPFTGAYLAGATQLHWGENAEADLAGYRLYRGTSAGFVPSPGNLVVAKADTGYADVGPAGSYYKLSAVDVHGNESAFALLTPAGTAAVESGAHPDLALVLTSANPGRGGASIRYSLAHAGTVQLAVFDLAGRELRVLKQGHAEPGSYNERWDGRTGGGKAVGDGVYLVRLTADGRERVLRVVLRS